MGGPSPPVHSSDPERREKTENPTQGVWQNGPHNLGEVHITHVFRNAGGDFRHRQTSTKSTPKNRGKGESGFKVESGLLIDEGSVYC